MRRGLFSRSTPIRSARNRLSTVSVYQLRLLFRVLLALIFVGMGLAAVTQRGGWWSALRARHPETLRKLATPVLSAAADSVAGTFTSFEVAAGGTGALQGTVVFAMNSSGAVTGPYLDSNRVAHGYLRAANGAITTFDAPDAGTGQAQGSGDPPAQALRFKNQGTIPIAINSAGVITGMYVDKNLAYHGFVRAANGTLTEFDAPAAVSCTGSDTYGGGTRPLAVNASGVIAGTFVDCSNFHLRGFLRAANGTITVLDAPGIDLNSGDNGGTIPIGIDSAGDVVGAYIDGNGIYHGFVRAANGTFSEFSVPGATTSGICCASQFGGTIPIAMNDAGVAAGTYSDANFVRHGFVRASNGTITEFDAPGAGLGMPPGLDGTGLFEGTGGFSIDPAGDVAGIYLDTNLAYHGFVRYSNGQFANFDASGAGTSTLQGTGIFSIGTTGEIAGTYVDASFVAHGFVVAPDATATPVFSPAAGTYTSPQTVTISDSTSGATIYYTTNGTTPSASSTKYTGPIAVSATETIEAIAVASGYANSAVASATYTFAAATPVFSPAVGTYTSSLNVTITDSTAGATIYCTTNGSAPTTSSTKYTGAITVSSTETIECIAVASGYTNSAVASATYTITSVAPPGALQFIPVTPCRIADTRNPTGAFGGPELAAATTRTFNVPQSSCNIPAAAVAYSLNVTVVPIASLGYLTMWPAGEAQPTVSTLNSDGRVKANATITPAGTNGGVSVYASDATQFILDIDGYFIPAGTSASGLEFFPLTPCRIADTRNPNAPLGGPSLTGGAARAFPVQSSACGIPSTAKAYSLNITAVPHGSLGYLTTWPTGQAQPVVSTLNATTGAVTANAAIVPAGTGGDISLFVSDTADVILDVNGYFAPPATGGLSLYTVTPCRALDTRSSSGALDGILTVPIHGSNCAPPTTAQAYVLNATVVPTSSLNYLTLWAAGGTQPDVSTLNAGDGAITSNMAIVPTTNGSVDAFATDSTQLLLDISSYFAP